MIIEPFRIVLQPFLLLEPFKAGFCCSAVVLNEKLRYVSDELTGEFR